jgi:DNA polymerase-3 subunit alpha
VPITVAESVEKHSDIIAERIYSEEEFDALEEGDEVVVGGEIISSKVITTKKKQEEMAFFEVVFRENSWSCTLFPKTYARFKNLLEADAVMVQGRKDNRGQIIVNMMMDVEQLAADLEADDG